MVAASAALVVVAAGALAAWVVVDPESTGFLLASAAACVAALVLLGLEQRRGQASRVPTPSDAAEEDSDEEWSATPEGGGPLRDRSSAAEG